MDTPPILVSADVVNRRPARIVAAPLLARPLLQDGARKPRGLKRLLHKMARTLHDVAYRRIGIAARGKIALSLPEGERVFSANFANTGYIDYANRSAVGGYEPEVTALLTLAARQANTVYDIGANWGYFVSVLMGDPSFRGHVHAFEISPTTYRDLSDLVAGCDLGDRVTCHPFGLSDRSGDVVIEEGRHSFLTRVSETATSGVTVSVARLDDLDLPDPDIIKIDVEGHEASVIRGGGARLARARPLIVFESWFDPDNTDAMLEPMRLLGELGYVFFRMSWQTSHAGAAVYCFEAPDGRPGKTNTLALMPLGIADRPTIPVALNIAAIHGERVGDFVQSIANRKGDQPATP